MATASITNTFVAATPAEAAEVNTNFTNLVTFLNNSVVHRDGSKAMTANFDAGSNKIVNLTAGTASADAVNYGQLTAANSPLPRGVMGYSQITADVTGVVLITLIGVGVTFTAVAGRRYKATFQGELYQSIAGDVFSITIGDGVGSLHRWYGSNSATTAKTRQVQYVSNASISGSKTWTVTLERVGGSGNGNIGAASDRPAFLVVEDIGPL